MAANTTRRSSAPASKGPKTVPVKPHKRSKPSTPAYPGPGRKPGPKPVPVKPYKRSKPS